MVSIDYKRILLTWASIAAVTGAAYLAAGLERGQEN
jgi:hypothetical protein